MTGVGLSLFLLVGAVVCRVPPEPGVSFSREAYAALGFVKVHVLRIDPAATELTLVRPEDSDTLSSVARMEGCDESLACFNGNFFEPDATPLGLMVSGGKVLKPLRRMNGGVFWIDAEGRVHVHGRREFARKVKLKKDVQFGIQGRPLLVREGKVLRDFGPDLSRRTAIGIDGDGLVVVIVAPFPTSLNALAEFARDRLGVTDLLNLDGGRSSQLVVPAEGDSASVVGMPVAVGVRVRGKGQR